jgi:simple sugar transport system ATP-binding protein
MMIGQRLSPQKEIRKTPQSKIALDIKSIQSRDSQTLKKIDLKLSYGEILGIAGVEGAGQKSLVETIMGLLPYKGQIEILGQDLSTLSTAHVRALGVGLLPQDRKTEALWGEESCYHNMIVGIEKSFTRFGFLRESKIQKTTERWSKAFDVRAPSLEVPVQSLSGGNQQKLVFAREVEGRQPKFLICHQPTRGVDLGATQKIHQTLLDLRNQGVAILLISSDLDELMKLSDRLLVLFDGESRGEFLRPEFDAFKIGRVMAGVKK